MANHIKLLLLGAVLAASLQDIYGHGKMMDPVNRSSLFRFKGKYPRAPVNWQDNENYCGGASVQHQTNGGKCGPCGDDYSDPIPRKNENGGTYGRGKIVKKYHAGAKIEVLIDLSTNHLGHFEFNICQLKNNRAAETEECFAKHPLKVRDTDGQIGYKYHVGRAGGIISVEVHLPEGFVCKRCVLRWHYRAGNNWGFCNDGTGGGRQGCGPQETFRSCSDIAIL